MRNPIWILSILILSFLMNPSNTTAKFSILLGAQQIQTKHHRIVRGKIKGYIIAAKNRKDRRKQEQFQKEGKHHTIVFTSLTIPFHMKRSDIRHTVFFTPKWPAVGSVWQARRIFHCSSRVLMYLSSNTLTTEWYT